MTISMKSSVEQESKISWINCFSIPEIKRPIGKKFIHELKIFYLLLFYNKSSSGIETESMWHRHKIHQIVIYAVPHLRSILLVHTYDV
jgi:hypothetical protein